MVRFLCFLFLRKLHKDVKYIYIYIYQISMGPTTWKPGPRHCSPAAAELTKRRISGDPAEDAAAMAGARLPREGRLWGGAVRGWGWGGPGLKAGLVGVDFCSVRFPSIACLLKNSCFPRGFGRFSGKKDVWKEWESYP